MRSEGGAKEERKVGTGGPQILGNPHYIMATQQASTVRVNHLAVEQEGPLFDSQQDYQNCGAAARKVVARHVSMVSTHGWKL